MIDTSIPAMAEESDADLMPIEQRYLLVLFSVPFYVDSNGKRYLEKLWAKDLVEHTRYLKNLTLAACSIQADSVDGLISVDDDAALSAVKYVALPKPTSTLHAIRLMPRTLRVLGREARSATIIHTSVAGWPIPEAWLMFLATRRRHLGLIIVESAFWRLPPGASHGFRQRVRAWVSERINRWCINRADVSIFTQEAYRTSLLTRRLSRGHVIEASWIDEGNIVSAAQVEADIARSRSDAQPFKLVFAGRLTREKGILLLVPVILHLVESGTPIKLDIFGEGPDKETLRTMIQSHAGGHAVVLRDSLPYGPIFFTALRAFDALVVPTLTDEQPRIVFDAYSQGVPVIASDTAGLVQCVANGVTGVLFTAGSRNALESTVKTVAENRDALLQMKSACVQRARASTHREMHRKRWKILARELKA